MPLAHLLREFGVPYVDGNAPPYRTVPVPGGGQMFRQYMLTGGRGRGGCRGLGAEDEEPRLYGRDPLPEEPLWPDAAASPTGGSRQYYHHLVRMPYMLADLGRHR